MNILSIGNSFSEDATFYLKKIADSANVGLTVVNLYIPACSISAHARNIYENNAFYRYELDGVFTDRVVSIDDALNERKWDVVTIQQRSGYSGIYATYGEDMKFLIDHIKKKLPQSQIYFHQTWAYEIDSVHDDFSIYGKNQEKMHNAITDAVMRACADNGIDKIIPSGELINEIRKTPEFDYKNGGKTLCRDGFHMDVVYGRFALGLLWFKVLLDKDVDDVTFLPREEYIINGFSVDNFECDKKLIDVIKSVVKKF